MMASGDLPDIIQGFGEYYTKGLDYAIEEDLIVDLTGYISRTAEEGDEYSAIMLDIETYVDQQIPAFITGESNLADWDTYVANIKNLNIVHAAACDSKDRIWAADRDGDAATVYYPDGTIAAYIHGTLGQLSGMTYDGEYMYVAGRGGYITIFNDDFEIVAKHGYFNSDLKAHGICHNSRGDLFLFPTHANADHQVIQMKRIR